MKLGFTELEAAQRHLLSINEAIEDQPFYVKMTVCATGIRIVGQGRNKDSSMARVMTWEALGDDFRSGTYMEEEIAKVVNAMHALHA